MLVSGASYWRQLAMQRSPLAAGRGCPVPLGELPPQYLAWDKKKQGLPGYSRLAIWGYPQLQVSRQIGKQGFGLDVPEQRREWEGSKLTDNAVFLLLSLRMANPEQNSSTQQNALLGFEQFRLWEINSEDKLPGLKPLVGSGKSALNPWCSPIHLS